MNIRKYCPTHGRLPGWLEWNRPVKEVTKTIIDGNFLVTKVEYLFCGCTFELRTPIDGKISKDGYTYINTSEGYKSQHRFVWEQEHGKLPDGWVVHHINGVRSDNRIENLIALVRAKHNNSIPEPFEVKCPHCDQSFKVIKQRNKNPITLGK